IRRLRVALARTIIAVGAAYRTDPFASFAADSLHRQSQQDLLLDHIGQLEAQTFIKPDFSLTLVNLYLVRLRVVERRTIKQVVTGFQRKRRQSQAAVAIRFERTGIPALNANFSTGVTQEPGRPHRANRSNLPQPCVREIDLPWFEGFVELNPPDLYLFD